MANIKNLTMGSQLLSDPRINTVSTLFGLSSKAVYVPTGSKISSSVYEYSAQEEDKLKHLLPLTGVTFPFVSNGGTAMIASWGLLAFLKATDTRQNASFAIRLPSRREDRRGAALAPKSTDEWEADDEED